MKSFLKFLFLFVCVIFIVAGMFTLHFFKRENLVAPRTVLGDTDLSGMTQSEVRSWLRDKLDIYNERPFYMAALGNVRSATLKQINASLDESAIMREIPFAGDLSNAELLFQSIAGKRVMVKSNIEQPEVLRIIDERFPEIPKARNAYFALDHGKLVVYEAEKGSSPIIAPVIEQLKKDTAFLEHRPLLIKFETLSPTVFVKDIEPYADAFKKIILQPIKLKFEKSSWNIDLAKHPDWIKFEAVGGMNNEFPFLISLDSSAFSSFLNEKITRTLERPAEDVRIWREADGNIIFEGRAMEGRAIEKQNLLTQINVAIMGGLAEVEIPMVVVRPKVEISDELGTLGIKEIIAIGHTRFKGSPVNRMHNIGVGISKFNGVLIEPDEIFSFGDRLGVVDGSTGYKKELVIKPEGTIPEYGGGLCQVSTTMYRAALYAGLPIVERAPHSFVVSYYSQVGGDGLDATIYPPAHDLKFKNDTPANILVQSYAEGVDAYYIFYGTSDGRAITMEGPQISNRRSAPTEPFETKDPKLAPGERKKVGEPHGGFDTLWYRIIVKNGETIKEEIFTRYNAVPAKYMVGENVNAAGENAGIIGGN